MWNQFNTGAYSGMIAETITMKGHNGDLINAYFTRPLGAGPYPAIVLAHHLPGWDELNREMGRRFTEHGFVTICPDLYHRFGQGTPDDLAAQARAAGRRLRRRALSATAKRRCSLVKALPYTNGKVGIIGTCSGGRHSVLVASSVQGFDAVVDCWGGRVVMAQEDLTPAMPVAPIDLTEQLSCPILGLFGNDDQSPHAGAGEPARGGAEEARQDLRVPPLRRRGPRLLVLPQAQLPPGAGDGRLGQGHRVLQQAPWGLKISLPPRLGVFAKLVGRNTKPLPP